MIYKRMIWRNDNQPEDPGLVFVKNGCGSGKELQEHFPELKTSAQGGHWMFVRGKTWQEAWDVLLEFCANQAWLDSGLLEDPTEMGNKLPLIHKSKLIWRQGPMVIRAQPETTISGNFGLYEDLSQQARRHRNVNSGFEFI